jgi:hypothetical protein
MEEKGEIGYLNINIIMPVIMSLELWQLITCTGIRIDLRISFLDFYLPFIILYNNQLN